MTMVPEAWQDNQFLSPTKSAFYEFNSCIMEPWDGPAMMVRLMLCYLSYTICPHVSFHKSAYHEFNSCIMEPWDGPAMMVRLILFF